MATEDGGPFYVVLGGKKAGIYEQIRPAKIALGSPKALVPIVVVCSTRNDAEEIFALHEVIFKITLPTDAYTMVYLLQRAPATTIELEVGLPIYAVQSGRETGVYIGYAWKEVRRFVEGHGKDVKPLFEGCQSLSEALIAMLKKPGANLPLLPAGVPLPPPPQPPRPPRQLRFDLPSDNDPEATPQPASRSASPTKGATRVPPHSPNPERPPHVVLHTTSPPPIPIDDAADMQELAAAFRELRAEPAMERLRRLIRPPHSMGGPDHPRLPPIVFGPDADQLLLGSGVGPGELLTLLQVRVHTKTIESFTHHVGLLLGWSTRDAMRLWETIRLPEL